MLDTNYMDANFFAAAYVLHGPGALAAVILAVAFAAWRKWIREWRALLLVMLPFILVWPLVLQAVALVDTAPPDPNLSGVGIWIGIGTALLWAWLAKQLWDEVSKREQVTSPWWAHLGVVAAVFGLLVALSTYLPSFARSSEVIVLTEEDMARIRAGGPLQAANKTAASTGPDASPEASSSSKPEPSITELRKAAESGDREALAQLGHALLSRPQSPAEKQEALSLFQKAYLLGHTETGVLLHMFYAGRTVGFGPQTVSFPADHLRARTLGEELLRDKSLDEASKMGVSESLAYMHLEALGGPRNVRAAAELLVPPADAGLPRAQLALSDIFFEGQGIPKNDEEGVRYLTLAAQGGLLPAQYALGWRLDKGDGIQKDPKASVHWYTQAANAGYSLAQTGLGFAYARGEGVPRDYETAYFWYILAAAGGEEQGLENLNGIEPLLTPEQRARAQARARDWKPVPISIGGTNGAQ